MKRHNTGKVCRKVAYYSKDKARQALKVFGRERGSTRSYKCPHCKGIWHLTSEAAA